jgi:purine nucleosidase
LKIIIDTDPGQDDAVAILLALGSPELEVLGITTVAGNVGLELTSRNARMVCELAGRPDIKVFAGADGPLAGPLVTAEHVHGKSGLDGPSLAAPAMALQPGHAVDFLVETIGREEPGSLTLCTLGPLTNVALALTREPSLAGRLRQLVMMGGGYFAQGNITPSAEFNVYVDPEAAQYVMASGVPIVMLPLDVTHQALTTRARMQRIAALGSPAAQAVCEMLLFSERYDAEKYGFDGGPLHDPTVIAWLLKPELFSGRRCHVDIETESELTRGASVVDWWQVTGREPNALVIGQVDAEGFFDLLVERLGNL